MVSSVVALGRILAGLTRLTPSLIRQKRGAARVFRSQLQAYGLDEAEVENLTKAYLELGSLKSWFGGRQKDVR